MKPLHKIEKKLTVRRAKPADTRIIKAMGIDTYHMTFITDPHYTTFIAIDSSTFVGVACCSITLDTANLDFIFVKEDFRSKGIGKHLLSAVEAWAVKNRVDGFGVNCELKNKGAIRFYTREGFKQVGKVYNYFSNKKTQLFFWKKP